jgi:predicted porin
MKKLVIAAAVLGAFTGAAQAQTSVTLYGIGDGDFRVDHTNIGSLKSVGSGGESGSRWGLRGSEDLGGGLKANFIFEQGFQLDDNSVAQGGVGGGASAGFGGTSTSPHNGVNGSSRLFSRIATVGLSGDFGEVRFGRAYHPVFLIQATGDPFGAGFVSEVSNLYTNNTIRNDNAIYYDTPRFLGGLQLSGAYQMGESTTNSATTQAIHGNDRYEGGITWASGPLYLGVGFESIKSNLETYRVKTADAAATYDFGFLKLHAIYWQTKNANPAPTAVSVNERVFSGGVTVPFGAWTFMGLYSRLNDKSTANNGANLGEPKVNSIGLGFRYSLSKRTIVYFGFDKFQLHKGPSGNVYQGFAGIPDASNAGLYTAGNLYGTQTPVGAAQAAVVASGTPINSNVNPYSYQIGIRHSF